MTNNDRPALVYADEQGRIFDWPGLETAGSSAGKWLRPERSDWVPLPPGSDLFVLPGRLPVGYDRAAKRFRVVAEDPMAPGRPVQAVAAFMAPAYAQILTAACKTLPRTPMLPLFSYTAVGWHQDRFVVTGVRVDADDRQDLPGFDQALIEAGVRRRLAAEDRNRLVKHLSKCALTYGCPAARNYFLERYEAPLPTSPSCNARCLGCISLQNRQDLRATQDRIGFVPTPDEIVAVAAPHLEQAPRAVVSFGQGCEGEPLLQGPTLRDAIAAMRRATGRGTINLNTNGSLPAVVEQLSAAGLDSIRVSLNSCRPEYYDAYFRPRGYRLAQLLESIQAMKAGGGFASINYLMLPGFTDSPEEFAALCRLVSTTGVDLIQMRNLNIDPEWYLHRLRFRPGKKPLGVKRWMERLRDRFPELRFGYFNPCLDPELTER